eukprot:UN14814
MKNMKALSASRQSQSHFLVNIFNRFIVIYPWYISSKCLMPLVTITLRNEKHAPIRAIHRKLEPILH